MYKRASGVQHAWPTNESRGSSNRRGRPRSMAGQSLGPSELQSAAPKVSGFQFPNSGVCVYIYIYIYIYIHKGGCTTGFK